MRWGLVRNWKRSNYMDSLPALTSPRIKDKLTVARHASKCCWRTALQTCLNLYYVINITYSNFSSFHHLPPLDSPDFSSKILLLLLYKMCLGCGWMPFKSCAYVYLLHIQGWANTWLESTSTTCQKIVILLLPNKKLKAFT